MISRRSPYAGILHEVVEFGGLIFFGGIVADDVSLDMAGQAEDVLKQLEKLLAASGADMSCVLQTTIYMTDLGDKEAFNTAWKRHFKADHLPARAVIGVSDLGSGVRLEMTAIGVSGLGRKG